MTGPSPWFRWSEVWGDEREEFLLAAEGEADVLVAVGRLSAVLDGLRAALGCPLRVTSWWRSEERNERVGGAPRSRHLYGAAADVVPVGFARGAGGVSAAFLALTRPPPGVSPWVLRGVDQLIADADGHLHVGAAWPVDAVPRGELLWERDGRTWSARGDIPPGWL